MGVSRQTASLSFPSMTGGLVARTATAPESVGAVMGRGVGCRGSRTAVLLWTSLQLRAKGECEAEGQTNHA